MAAAQQQQQQQQAGGGRGLGGTAVLAFFFTTWISAGVFAALAVPVWLLFGVTWPPLALAAYSLLRLVWHAPLAPRIHEWLGNTLAAHPYFRVQRLVFESDDARPAPDSATMLAVFPHGATCVGWTVNLNLSPVMQKSKIHYLVAPALLRLPLISEVMYMCSTFSASKRSMLRLMRAKKNIAILPGGFEEAALFKRGKYDVFINDRKGFIKYALEHGYSVSPVFSFGEEQTYFTLESFLAERKTLAKHQIPPVVFWSRWLWLPDPSASLVTVVGNPVRFAKVSNPTFEQVDAAHAEFVQALTSLFMRYKSELGIEPNSKLSVH
ncbi:hypothetical protein HDU84_007479 [Entophlyctis sp. JEL0112]|nr:hypothetical protein HDU84_007479 [Entophlyctis sp. JEL0112]